MLGDSRAKEFEIDAGNSTLSAGEHVMIRINQSSGYAAILYLYMIPFLLMLLTLIGTLNLGYSEVYAGIAALLVLIPYFLLVFAGRRKLAAHCEVTLERL
jgi:sigma-E factor negative regulatory protein RseC